MSLKQRLQSLDLGKMGTNKIVRSLSLMGEQTGLIKFKGRLKDGDALRSGWLKKQGGFVKTWHTRWFVLRRGQLYYYKNDEEAKEQGAIPLLGNRVNPLVTGSEEQGKHLFEILPGADRDRMSSNHESYLLMASSQGDMEEWVKAIRRATASPSLSKGVFGQRLEETVRSETGSDGVTAPAPLLVTQCVNFIRCQGLAEEGLFRLPGQTNLVRELQEAFDCGERPIFDGDTDVHTVASLVKLYLRELPEPVVPFSLYSEFLSCASLLAKNQSEGVKELTQLANSLPLANFNLLKYICSFLYEVQSHASINKMSIQNLATVFGPNILRPKVEDPATIMEGATTVQHLMSTLIEQHVVLFARGPEASKSSLSRTNGTGFRRRESGVSWDESSSPAQTDGGALSSPLSLCAEQPGCYEKNGLGFQSGSLSQDVLQSLAQGGIASELFRDKPFKARKYSSMRISVGKQMRPSQNVAIANGDEGASEQGRDDRTPSGWAGSADDPRDESHSPVQRRPNRDSPGAGMAANRQSTYDNVAPPGNADGSPGACEGAMWCSSVSKPPRTRNHASSCGDEPPGTSDDAAAARFWLDDARGQSAAAQRDRLKSSGSDWDPMLSPTDSASSINTQVLSNLMAKMQMELSKQKLDYEGKIRSLETCKQELQGRVTALSDELEQERKKTTMLEIRMRNAERAQADAEQRNAALQREMEGFFTTFGCLQPQQ
ncbi:rho GTPase-activating protein 24-like isoform X2 [Lampetra planeri]